MVLMACVLDMIHLRVHDDAMTQYQQHVTTYHSTGT